MAETTVKPSTKKVKKKEEINWVSFYLFAIQWITGKMNLSTWHTTYYFKEWIMGLRLGIAALVFLIIVLDMSIGAFLLSIKFIAVYIVMELIAIIVAYQSCKNDSIINSRFNDLSENQKLLFKNESGKQYTDALSSYKDMLKRKEDEDS